jgi:hypothetical protein
MIRYKIAGGVSGGISALMGMSASFHWYGLAALCLIVSFLSWFAPEIIEYLTTESTSGELEE